MATTPDTKKTAAAPEKKRTIYQRKSALALPEWTLKDKEHSYRWCSTRVQQRSDGFDPRGWSVAKHPETGEVTRHYDLILSRMPIDEFQSMKEFKRNEAREMTLMVMENMSDMNDRMRYEIERAGGKIGNDFSIKTSYAGN